MDAHETRFPEWHALGGHLNVAGYNPLPEQIPLGVLEQAPARPALGKLVFTGPDDNKFVCCPDALVKDWYHHPVFGVRFRAFLDAFHEDTLGETCGVISHLM